MEKKEYLQTLKVVELKKICKDSHILGVHSKKKSELIELMCDCVLTGLDALTTEKHQPKHPTITNEIIAQRPTNYDKALLKGKEILSAKI
tara:strand:+ start:433 stop:702 length:270 start_codon:yes stop_codon:yes gene_type:complete